jgi:hypothetical protein
MDARLFIRGYEAGVFRTWPEFFEFLAVISRDQLLEYIEHLERRKSVKS